MMGTVVRAPATPQRDGCVLVIGRAAVSLCMLALLCVALALGSRAVAARGGQLAYETDRDGNREIYLLDLATGLQRNLTHRVVDDYNPTWSPDGTSLAFYADVDSDRIHELYVMDTTSRAVRQIALRGGGNSWRASWSPAGGQIAFLLGYDRITVSSLDGGEPEHVGLGFGPTWSPDGTRLLFYNDPDGRLNGDVYMLELGTKRAYNLTAHRANDWDPAWSPDGRSIAFASSRDGNAEIYVMDATCTADLTRIAACGRSVRRLTHTSTNEITPAWSPDSRQLAVVSRQGLYDTIYVMNADGSGLRRLTSDSVNSRFPVWRP